VKNSLLVLTVLTGPEQTDVSWWKLLRVEASRNVMVHARTSPFNWRGRQFSRLLAAEVCAPAVVLLATPCSEVVWRALATHSIRQFPLHFPSRASPCAITFQLESTASSTGFHVACCKNTCYQQCCMFRSLSVIIGYKQIKRRAIAFYKDKYCFCSNR